MRVLLVDDEEEFVSTLAERLCLRDIEADWVTTGREALEICDRISYDIAVLDVKIPMISGIELKRRLQEKCPGMKFIFMTGHGSEANFEEGAAETGDKFYLVKPVKIETLIERMKEVLEERGAGS